MVQILRALQQKHDVTNMLSAATLAVRDALEAKKVTLWFNDGQGTLEEMDMGHDDEFDFGLDAHAIDLDDDAKEKGMDIDAEQSKLAVRSVFEGVARYCDEAKVVINTPNIFEDQELWESVMEYTALEHASALTENHWFLHRACSVLSVPIETDSAVVGVIQAVYKKDVMNQYGFNDADQQIVESVSSEIAHALARNMSELVLEKIVATGAEDIPLEVVEYWMTGSLAQRNHGDAAHLAEAASISLKEAEV